MTIRSSFEIHNESTKTLEFHLEPECWSFYLKKGESATIRGEYDREPPSIQFSDSDDGAIFGAVFPGDGDVVIEKNGVIIIDGTD